jgi:hypothetical protein
MSPARAALLVAIAALLLPGAGDAAPGWKTYRNAAGGFSIAVPAGWQVIPTTRASRLALAAKLRSSGQTDRARLVGSYAAPGHTEVSGRVFQAVQYPELAGAITTDVTVTWTELPAASRNARGLEELSSVVSGRLAREQGVTLATRQPRPVSFQYGRGYLIYGSAPAAGLPGPRTGFATYLLLGHGGAFNLTLRTDSRYFDYFKNTFGSIAATFAVAR